MSEETSTTKKITKYAAIGLAFTAAAIGGFRSYKIVQPNHFGIRIKWGQVQPQTIGPGMYLKSPVFDTIDTFNNNVVISEANAGSGRNTKDQNSYSASIRIHYQITPDAGVLAFHLDEMADENGKALLDIQINNAMNAVVGQRTTPETLISPPEVLKGFLDQLEWRLKQNNIAVTIDTVEMLTQNVGTSSDSLRLPVQLKVKPGAEVESMAGPSVPVDHLIITPAPKAAAAPAPKP